MNDAPTWQQRLVEGWLGFWFPLPEPRVKLALIRIGTGLLLLYVLYVRSFDLEPLFSRADLPHAPELDQMNPVGWKIGLMQWFPGGHWLWTVHVVAILLALLLVVGFFGPLCAFLSLLIQAAYAQHNPAMVISLDGLIMVALFYLMLTPSGKVLGVLSRFELAPTPQPHERKAEGFAAFLGEFPWAGLGMRMLQIHLCLLYFHSALGKMSGPWMHGIAFWHPRLLSIEAPLTLQGLQDQSTLVSLIVFGLVLFELAYSILIWLPRFRYPVMMAAIVIHLGLMAGWGQVPFNLLMIVLNLVFLSDAHLELIYQRLGPWLRLPWLGNATRGQPRD